MASQNKKEKDPNRHLRAATEELQWFDKTTANVRQPEWVDRLTAQVKAEILATVLHELSCTRRKDFKKLPQAFQKLVQRTMRDCSIMHDDLSKNELRQMGEYFHSLKN